MSGNARGAFSFAAVSILVLLLVSCGELGRERAGNGPDTGEARSIGIAGGDEGRRVSTAKGHYTRVSPEELDAMLKDDDDVVLVNTHVPFEGDIPGTDLSIPYDEVDRRLERLPEDRGTRIAVYCKSGRMSAAAAEELVSLGYGDVWDLAGGMEAWRRAGLPIGGVR